MEGCCRLVGWLSACGEKEGRGGDCSSCMEETVAAKGYRVGMGGILWKNHLIKRSVFFHNGALYGLKTYTKCTGTVGQKSIRQDSTPNIHFLFSSPLLRPIQGCWRGKGGGEEGKKRQGRGSFLLPFPPFSTFPSIAAAASPGQEGGSIKK